MVKDENILFLYFFLLYEGGKKENTVTWDTETTWNLNENFYLDTPIFFFHSEEIKTTTAATTATTTRQPPTLTASKIHLTVRIITSYCIRFKTRDMSDTLFIEIRFCFMEKKATNQPPQKNPPKIHPTKKPNQTKKQNKQTNEKTKIRLSEARTIPCFRESKLFTVVRSAHGVVVKCSFLT